MKLKSVLFFSMVLALIPMIAFADTQVKAASNGTGFLAGKTAVISGGTGGIGKAISMELAKAGANVVFITHNAEVAKQLIKEMGDKYGVKGGYTECLITDEKQVQAMVKYVVDNFGSLDIAVNEAGAPPYDKSYPAHSVAETSAADWDSFIDNSLKGYFFSMKYEIEQMKKQGHGVIINSALDGLHDVKENIGLYYTAKAGVEALTKTAALENKNSGVRLNVVYSDSAIANEETAGQVVAALCADSASNITGNSVNANLTK